MLHCRADLPRLDQLYDFYQVLEAAPIKCHDRSAQRHVTAIERKDPAAVIYHGDEPYPLDHLRGHL